MLKLTLYTQYTVYTYSLSDSQEINVREMTLMCLQVPNFYLYIESRTIIFVVLFIEKIILFFFRDLFIIKLKHLKHLFQQQINIVLKVLSFPLKIIQMVLQSWTKYKTKSIKDRAKLGKNKKFDIFCVIFAYYCKISISAGKTGYQECIQPVFRIWQ